MTAPSPIIDNAEPWVKHQIDEYLATGGERPVFRGNAPLLLLTTQGRKSGEWRRTCLIYGPNGDDFLIVASIGGAPKHPLWYLNLDANPRVWLTVGAESFWAIARTATSDEKPPLWQKMVGIFSDYAKYQKGLERDIPVVILTREN
jgi:deazaflavin-dependent oxidoreductase (nitroreductase family)